MGNKAVTAISVTLPGFKELVLLIMNNCFACFRARLSRLYLLVFCLYAASAKAQIGAEAQGGKLTGWIALGIDQKIAERWISMTDLGYGRHSDPDNTQFTKRPGLNVITQDFIYEYNKHWSLALGIGYWRRQYYTDDAPFDHRAAPYEYRNEFRPYQRVYYKQQWEK